MKRNLFLCALLITLVHEASGAVPGAATAYPVKPIRFIVPYPTGGAPDLLARMIGAQLTGVWGQQVLADNRAGANGTIASEITARSARDGYTIQMGSVATHAINPALYAKIPYDPLKDFTFITQIGYTAIVIAANPSVQAATVKELIALAKSTPAPLTYGSSGSGSVGHLAAEMFKAAAGIPLAHVPYKGIAAATTELIGGQISLTFGNMLNVLPHIKTGKLKTMGITSVKRSPVLPDTPAIAETLPGFEAILWWGVFAPAAIPQPVAAKLNGEIVRILNQPDLRARWAKEGTVITGTTPEQLAALVKTDVERWARAVKISGAHAD